MSGQHDRPETEQPEAEAASENGADGSASESVEAPDGDTALAELQALADENWDKYVRAAAELENVRKRASKDVENAHKFALERFCSELLAVKDSLEMGLAAADKADAQSLLEGKKATLNRTGFHIGERRETNFLASVDSRSQRSPYGLVVVIRCV